MSCVVLPFGGLKEGEWNRVLDLRSRTVLSCAVGLSNKKGQMWSFCNAIFICTCLYWFAHLVNCGSECITFALATVYITLVVVPCGCGLCLGA